MTRPGRSPRRLALVLVTGVTACGAPAGGPSPAPPLPSPSQAHPTSEPADGEPGLEGPTSSLGLLDRDPRGQDIEGRPFTDVTEQAGLSGSAHGFVGGYTSTGQAFGDYDSDGDPDLYVTDATGANTLYENRGDGTFVVSRLAGQVSLPEHSSGGAIFADFDADGDQDLYVLGKGPNVLFENDDGKFVDVTAQAGVGDPGMGQTASFADFDGDGRLDLYVANWQCDDCGIREEGAARRSDRLYRNRGDRGFEDVTAWLGHDLVDGFAFIGGWTDVDDDGDLDLYVVNDKGYAGPRPPDRALNRHALFRNDGPGCEGWCFTEVAEQMGADGRVDGMGLAVADYDGDLDLDLFYTHTFRPELLRRTAAGFEEVGIAAGITMDTESWGAVFFDHDNDGDPDLYVAVGMVFGTDNPNRLYENLGDGTFADVSAASGALQPRYSMGVATADVDGDGWVDLLVGNYAGGYRLLRNNGARQHPDRHWLRIRLEGPAGGERDAIGAKVWVESSDGRRQVQEVRAGDSHGSGSDRALHFGLGAAVPTAIEIRWPDGRLERLEAPPVDVEWRRAHPG